MTRHPETYERLAVQYDRLMESTPYYRNIRRAEVRALRRLIASAQPASLMDIGCGTGLASEIAARHGLSVVALDPSAAMLGLARARLRPFQRRVRFLQSTIEDLKAYTAPVDAIVSFGSVLNHVDDWDTFFAKIAACSRPGTQVLLSVDNLLGVDSFTWAAFRLLRSRLDGVRDLRRRTLAYARNTAHVNSWPLVYGAHSADVHLRYRPLSAVCDLAATHGFHLKRAHACNLFASLSPHTVLSSSALCPDGTRDRFTNRLLAFLDVILGDQLWRLSGTAVIWLEHQKPTPTNPNHPQSRSPGNS